MRIYCLDADRIKNEKNKYLNPIIKWANFSANQTKARLVEDINTADIITIPNTYSFYYFNGDIGEIERRAEQAAGFNKRLVVWHNGDLNPPIIKNVVYLQTSVDRSSDNNYRIPVPYFIDDPAEKIFKFIPKTHEMTDFPEVGFCGYAAAGYFKIIFSILMNLKSIYLSKLNSRSYEFGPILPSVLLRGKILNLLSKDVRVRDDFIIRNKYKAGFRKTGIQTDESNKSVRDFYNNIIENQYIICIRGYGNFSIRFFETLACGRIPIVIDTDTRLPFDNSIDYREYCVWVPQGSYHQIGNILIDFHGKLTDTKIHGIQAGNRKLWEQRLSFTGFFNHFIDLLPQINR